MAHLSHPSSVQVVQSLSHFVHFCADTILRSKYSSAAQAVPQVELVVRINPPLQTEQAVVDVQLLQLLGHFTHCLVVS